MGVILSLTNPLKLNTISSLDSRQMKLMLIGLNHQKKVLFQILQNIVHLQGWD